MCADALFKIFGHEVHLYGILIALGIVAAIIVLYFYTKKRNMNQELQDYIFFVAIIAIIVGFIFAKLFQAVYNWIEKGYFDFAGAGITAMGGFVGGAAVFIAIYFGVGKFYFKNKNNIHIKQFGIILNVAPCCITVAHAFGRIGCLMAGCCHGALLSKTQYVVGGIWMKVPDGAPGFYVPTQLYEALFLFVLFAVLSILYFKKRCNVTVPIYLVAYGVWRIFIEIFRADARGAIILGLAPSQWFSIIFIVGGIVMLLIYYFKKIPFFLSKEKIEEYKTQYMSEKNIDKNDDTDKKE